MNYAPHYQQLNRCMPNVADPMLETCLVEVLPKGIEVVDRRLDQ